MNKNTVWVLMSENSSFRNQKNELDTISGIDRYINVHYPTKFGQLLVSKIAQFKSYAAGL